MRIEREEHENNKMRIRKPNKIPTCHWRKKLKIRNDRTFILYRQNWKRNKK